MTGGHIELERAVSSIIVGNRHRTDLGDIDALAASIDRDGLLQPLTVTPDGVLVCGRRRLAAIQKLGWRTVNVWVRSGISDRLGHLLAEQDDNVLHKDLTSLEAASLYRELKELLADDATRRQKASRFGADQPSDADPNGGGNFPAPYASGETRQQAAAMIPGAASYRTLDKIEFIQQTATRDDLTNETRAKVTEALAQIETGAPVHPLFEEIRALTGDGQDTERDADLDRMAQEAIARAKAAKPNRRTTVSAVPRPAVWTTRSFIVIWSELQDWWTHYDPTQLAAELTGEQIEMFLTIAAGTDQFANDLAAARTDPASRKSEDGDPTSEVRHLRAL